MSNQHDTDSDVIITPDGATKHDLVLPAHAPRVYGYRPLNRNPPWPFGRPVTYRPRPCVIVEIDLNDPRS